mgnify:CR=1 FL=1
MGRSVCVDLDQLRADPVFAPLRFSFGFHPLHSLPAIALYGLALVWAPSRIIAVGLLIHMLLDATDCVLP